MIIDVKKKYIYKEKSCHNFVVCGNYRYYDDTCLGVIKICRIVRFCYTFWSSKTIVYAIIFCGFLLACTQGHSRMENTGKVLLTFTLFTVISTFFGVTPDIPFWRQAIHLTIFASAFWTMYIAIEQFGITGCTGMVKFSYILIALVYSFAIITGKKIEGNVVYYLLMFLPLTAMIKSNLLRKILYLLQGFVVLVSK